MVLFDQKFEKYVIARDEKSMEVPGLKFVTRQTKGASCIKLFPAKGYLQKDLYIILLFFFLLPS